MKKGPFTFPPVRVGIFGILMLLCAIILNGIRAADAAAGKPDGAADGVALLFIVLGGISMAIVHVTPATSTGDNPND